MSSVANGAQPQPLQDVRHLSNGLGQLLFSFLTPLISRRRDYVPRNAVVGLAVVVVVALAHSTISFYLTHVAFGLRLYHEWPELLMGVGENVIGPLVVSFILVVAYVWAFRRYARPPLMSDIDGPVDRWRILLQVWA